MIVSDTCLVVHLCNSTEFTLLAEKILSKDSSWILPHIWQNEYANVLSKISRKGHLSIDEVITHFNSTVVRFKNSEIFVDNRKALKVSMEYKISLYDAHFIVLANDYNIKLVTEDKEILKKCPHIAVNLHGFLNAN